MLSFMGTFMKFPATGAATPPSRSALSDIISRDRYQIAVGIALAVGTPVIVRSIYSQVDLTAPVQYNTVTATIIAILFGYMSFRKIHVFRSREAPFPGSMVSASLGQPGRAFRRARQ